MNEFNHIFEFESDFGCEALFRPQVVNKKVFKKAVKVVKKVVNSPIGKIAMAALAVYTGGAALGAWGAAGAAGAGAGAAGAAGAGAAAAGTTAAATSSWATAAAVASKVSTGIQALSAINTFTGSQKEQAVQDFGPQIAAQRRMEALQAENLKKQEEATTQQRNVADQQETELSGALAAQKNAVLARRRSRGGLAFSGPTTGVKTTLGG